MATVIVIIVSVMVVFNLITTFLEKAQKRASASDTCFTGTQECQPYANIYGKNRENGPCAVTVTASPELAVIVIIRHDNIDGRVAGHLLIEKGSSGTICLTVGTFQTFFYFGRDWEPRREMDCGLFGGFINGEIFQEDPVAKNYTEGMMWEYKLRLVSNGNFAPVSTDKDLFF